MKPGRKTTEFWILFVIEALLAVLQIWQGKIEPVAAASMAGAAAVYGASRAHLKTFAPPGEGEEEELP